MFVILPFFCLCFLVWSSCCCTASVLSWGLVSLHNCGAGPPQLEVEVNEH